MDEQAEHQFWMDYAGGYALLDVCSGLVLAVSQLPLLLSGSTPALAVHYWCRLIMGCSCILGCDIFGWRIYTLSVRQRVGMMSMLACAVGAGFSMRPRQGSRYSLSTLCWQHRLLFVSTAAALCRMPVAWHVWASCWAVVAAALVDVADPACMCGISLPCSAAAVWSLLSDPAVLVKRMGSARALQSIVTHLADVTLPGLALAVVERRARAAWRARQHRANPGLAAAAADGPAFSDEHQQRHGNPGNQHRVVSGAAGTAAAAGRAAGSPGLTALDATGEAAAADGLPRGVPSSLDAYVSPLRRAVVAVKVEETGDPAVGIDEVGSHVSAYLQSALSAGPAATASAAAAPAAAAAAAAPTGEGADNQPAAFVTQRTAFMGCYQLVFQLVAPVLAHQQQQHQAGQPGPAAAPALAVQLQQLLTQVQLPAGLQVMQLQVGQRQVPVLSQLPASASAAAAPIAPAATAEAAGSTGAASGSTGGSILLMPATICLPDSSSGNGSGGKGAAAGSAIATQLCISRHAAQQLVKQRAYSVRVVVAAHSSGLLLLDRTYQLQDRLPAEGPDSAESGAQGVLLPVTLDIDLVAEAAAAAAAEQQERCNLQQPLVCSVTAVAAWGAAHEDSQVEDSAAAADAAKVGPSSSIVSMPLLLLPAPVHHELQQLFTAAAHWHGMNARRAYEWWLPLLQDLGTLLLWQQQAGSSAWSAVPRSLQQVLSASLSRFFASHPMVECSRLVGSMEGSRDSGSTGCCCYVGRRQSHKSAVPCSSDGAKHAAALAGNRHRAGGGAAAAVAASCLMLD